MDYNKRYSLDIYKWATENAEPAESKGIMSTGRRKAKLVKEEVGDPVDRLKSEFAKIASQYYPESEYAKKYSPMPEKPKMSQVDAWYEAMSKFNLEDVDTETLRSVAPQLQMREEQDITSSLEQPYEKPTDTSDTTTAGGGQPSSGKGLMTKPTKGGLGLDSAVDTILDNEGGFQQDADDTGNYVGKKLIGTNLGITPTVLAEYRGVEPSEITTADIKGVTPEEARKIYKERYFYGSKVDQLPQELQASVFDMNVNSGRNSIKILQRLAGVAADGVLGEESIAAIKDAGITADQYADARIDYYKQVAENNPKKKKFLDGWIARANKFRGEE